MPVVLLRKDPFVQGPEALRDLLPVQSNRGVRRPLYGYLPKPDRFASLSLLQAGSDGGLVPVSILDSAGIRTTDERGVQRGRSNANHNFFVTGISHSDQEKMQVVETFGDDFVFFFGRRPLVIGVNGLLMNTTDFDWKSEWMENYNRYLRGTKCVENKTRVYLRIDDTLYSGYIFKTDVNDNSDLPNVSQFSFNMLVFGHVDISERSVGSFIDTLSTPDGLYVEYVDGPLESLEMYEIDPSTGQSRRTERAAFTDAFTKTETEVLQALDRLFQDIGARRVVQSGEAGLEGVVFHYDTPPIQVQ